LRECAIILSVNRRVRLCVFVASAALASVGVALVDRLLRQSSIVILGMMEGNWLLLLLALIGTSAVVAGTFQQRRHSEPLSVKITGPVTRRLPFLLTDRAITTVVATVVAFSVLLMFGLLAIADHASIDRRVELRIDVIKYSLGAVASGGALAALLLSVRRQRLAEQAQVHTEMDAAERRITELYIKAADQLGSDKAAVRLAGLFALERLAQDNPGKRQSIVEVVCAYLRMPYTPPAEALGRSSVRVRRVAGIRQGQSRRPIKRPTVAGHDLQEELQVRLSAQGILCAHLILPYGISTGEIGAIEADIGVKYWPNISLNLDGATLVNWSLAQSHIPYGNFSGASFFGDTSFYETTFTGPAFFNNATFHGDVAFTRSRFMSFTLFENARFCRDAGFHDSIFVDALWFRETIFDGRTMFDGADFHAGVTFSAAVFHREPSFDAIRIFNIGEHEDRWPDGWQAKRQQEDVSVGFLVRGETAPENRQD
jgi:Pentapeptide repeats (9 copies)